MRVKLDIPQKYRGADSPMVGEGVDGGLLSCPLSTMVRLRFRVGNVLVHEMDGVRIILGTCSTNVTRSL